MATEQTRNISLSPQQDAFIERLLAGGRYRTASEVARHGLRLLEEAEQRRLLEKWVYEGLSDDEQDRIPPALLESVKADFRQLLDDALREVAEGRVSDGPEAMQRLVERIADRGGATQAVARGLAGWTGGRRSDHADPRKPTGVRGVFLKKETPPGLWGYLAKTIGLWLLGIASVVWLLFGLAAWAGDGEPGVALGLATIYAVLFLVVRKIPTRKPEDFLPEGYLEEYQERKRKARDS
ncbi:MAG: type II toxin-antitoxin system ParD family antitoxin [Gemmatimonadales bacterium]|nr:type II toxin-antitoxin system ParD family antitoxin [Candidatus Palauibacter irciniicola]MYC19032.1 type II toxin-antitoxin system ParD family antitoxin [Gemmatimonadales bacterium]